MANGHVQWLTGRRIGVLRIGGEHYGEPYEWAVTVCEGYDGKTEVLGAWNRVLPGDWHAVASTLRSEGIAAFQFVRKRNGRDEWHVISTATGGPMKDQKQEVVALAKAKAKMLRDGLHQEKKLFEEQHAAALALAADDEKATLAQIDAIFDGK